MIAKAKGVPFTLEESERAYAEWRFNCGPGALCAVLNLTPAQLRPHLLDFETKGYTNPTLMFAVLRGLNVRHHMIYRSDSLATGVRYPNFGLVRVQWGGPWTQPEVPMAARYRKTHWIATRIGGGAEREAFDINAVSEGGWLPWHVWSCRLVPWLLRECEPRATGEWWPTHCIEVEANQTTGRAS